MKNIIFLDIDGVLNNNNKIIVSEESINVLKEFIKKYNAKVVLISSWQMSGTFNRRKLIKEYFDELGIYDIDFIDPNFVGEFCDIKINSRLLGIIDYLKKEELCNYVILDDEYYNNYKLLCLNHYRTKSFKGLTYKDYDKILFKTVNYNNFKNINYRYRKLGEYEIATNNLIKVLKKVKG